jgi:hypothetical protein
MQPSRGIIETGKGKRMTPAEQQAYRRGVTDVLAIVAATAAQIEKSGLLILRRELATETLRAVAEEARALIGVGAEGADHGR